MIEDIWYVGYYADRNYGHLYNGMISREDLIQEGMIGLCRAWRNYDDSYGVKFTTYATKYLKGCMYEYIQKNIMEMEDIMDYELELESDDNYEDIIYSILECVMDHREREILLLKLSGLSNKEIGKLYGISGERIRQIISGIVM